MPEAGVSVEAPIAPQPPVAEAPVAQPTTTESNGTPAIDNEQDVIKNLEDKVSAAKDVGTESVIGKPKENQSILGKDADVENEAEAKLPAESPTIPEKVANDPEYKKTWGDLYEQSRAGGKEVDLSAVDKQALSDYYNKSAKTQLENGLPQEITNDPLYQQKLGEAMTKAQGNGELLDGKKLSQEALAKYQQEKDLQGEKPAENKTEQLTTDEQLQEIQQRIGAILENNGEKLESAMVTVSAKDLALLLKALAEAKEPNPKKKESKLMMLVKLLGVLVLSGVMETGKTVIPPTGQR